MTTIDKLEVEISTDASRLQTGMTQASQSVSSFTDRVSKSAATLQGFGSVGMQAMGVMDRYQLSTMSVENAMTSLQDAQTRYNMALDQFGEGSQQAIFAMSSLTRATNQYEAAQTQANLSLAMMGLTMFGMIPQILKFGTTAVATLKNVEIAALLTSARIKALAPELLILSAIVGGTYYLWSQRTQEVQSTTENLTRSLGKSSVSVVQLRGEIAKLTGELEDLSKPEERYQTPMEQFLEFQATGIMPKTITPKQSKIQEKTIEKAKLEEALYIEESISAGEARRATTAQESAMQALRAGVPLSPTYGADRANTIIVNATITTTDNPAQVMRDIAFGAAAGLNQSQIRVK